MLVYLKYCFTGLAFPPGNYSSCSYILFHFFSFIVCFKGIAIVYYLKMTPLLNIFAGRGTIPPTRLQSLRKELVEFLLEDSNALKSQTNSKQPYLNLYLLLELDTEATLDVLRCAFVEDEISIAGSSSLNSADQFVEEAKEENDVTEPQKTLVQNTVDALVQLIDMKVSPDTTSSTGDDGSIKEWPLKDIGYLFEFIAYYVAFQRAKVSKAVLCQILEYLTSDNVSIRSSTPKNREKQVLALLEVLPESDWDAAYVLELCERAQYHQVSRLTILMILSSET